MHLIQPTISLKAQYLDMLADWHQTGEDLVPFPIKYDPSNFEQMVNRLLEAQTIADEGFVCHSTFWLVNSDNKILGVSNLRHELNDHLLKEGGHIGYGIRPSERRKGYATSILRLSLLEAKKLNIKKVLVTCAKHNIGSAKTILKNGGRLWKEVDLNGETNQNYWIAN